MFRPYSIFDEKSGLKKWIWTVKEHKGKIYAGNSYGLHTITNLNGNYHFEPIGNLKSVVWDLVSAGQDLIVGADDGVFKLGENGVQRIAGTAVNTLYRSQIDSNRIFVGHSKGLFAIYRKFGTWVEEGNIPSIKQDILSIGETSSGDLWLGTRVDGILYLKAGENRKWGKNNEPQIYNQERGVPPAWSRIYILDDVVRIRTDCEFNQDCFHIFQREEDIFVPDLSFGKTFGSKKEVYPVGHQPKEHHFLLREKDSSNILLSAFHLGNGKYEMNNIELESLDLDFNKSRCWQKEKVMWLGGEALVRYDLTLNFKPNPNFPVYVRKVTTTKDSTLFAGVKSSSMLELTKNENALRFAFAAPFFDLGEKNQYRYKLEGFDKDWSNWGTETIKDYTNIPAGEYRFKVRAKNIYGAISSEGIFAFTIFPPWYGTSFAYLLYILLIILIGWLVLKWRVGQLVKEKNVLEKMVMERTSEVREQAHKLEELNRAKSQFFANISHEFRTPLTLIKGPIEHLEQNPKEKLSMENIRMIRRNSDRVLTLVNQLLDLSKIDEGSLKLETSEGDVFQCLRTAASSFNSLAAQYHIDYDIQVPQAKYWTIFDQDKLENVVYNLLGNAFKFSGDSASISFGAVPNELGIKIQISDTGKGIEEEKLPFIFDRFYQADGGTTKEREGSGIGLALSKNLIELMNGKITVASELNKGTIFKVQLPLRETTFAKEPLKNIVREKDKTSQRHVPGREPFDIVLSDNRDFPGILLVEDNADMRRFIKEHLINSYKVKEAVNGEVGFKKALSDPPDLIITDLMMPKMDGIELCKKLKTNLNTSHIPVIMLTAKAGMDNKIEGLETGADDYLTKPFDGKELLVRTKNLIEQRKRLRELFSNQEFQIDPKNITTTSMDQKFLEQVLLLLEDNHPSSIFGVPQMQQALAMSKSQLHRKLKALTNESPGELLRNFRLKRAAQLLAQKADTVTQIAYQVGFNDLSYFAKCFKELYGVVPSSI